MGSEMCIRDRLLTAKSKKMNSDVLGVVQAGGRPLSLLQVDQPMNTTTAVPPRVDDTPVKGADGPDCESSGDPSACMKSCPINVQPLSTDLSAVKSAFEGMVRKKGFLLFPIAHWLAGPVSYTHLTLPTKRIE